MFGLLGVIPIFFPHLIECLPNAYKTNNYVNYISGVSVTLGSIAGMLFLFLAFIQQQIEFNSVQKERERQKSQEITERFIDSYQKIKGKIEYGKKHGEAALEKFYDVHKNHFQKPEKHTSSNSEFSFAFREKVDQSVLTKGGGLNLYSRAVKNLMIQIVKAQTFDLIPFWEESLSEKEKVLIFYLFKFYFTDFKEFDILIENGFLESINPHFLINEDHINW